MTQFGRRTAGSPSSHAASPQDQVGKASPATLVFAGLVGLFALIFSPAKYLHADLTTPLPADLSPGAQVIAPAYDLPAGCPPRSWAVGEYLPKVCLEERIDAELAAKAGLEAPLHVGKGVGRRKWSGFRQRAWIRAGDDVLLVTGPPGGSARIVHVAANRFGPGKPATRDVSGATAFRRPPADYLLRCAFDLLFVPFVLLAVISYVVFVHLPRQSAKPTAV